MVSKDKKNVVHLITDSKVIKEIESLIKKKKQIKYKLKDFLNQ